MNNKKGKKSRWLFNDVQLKQSAQGNKNKLLESFFYSVRFSPCVRGVCECVDAWGQNKAVWKKFIPITSGNNSIVFTFFIFYDYIFIFPYFFFVFAFRVFLFVCCPDARLMLVYIAQTCKYLCNELRHSFALCNCNECHFSHTVPPYSFNGFCSFIFLLRRHSTCHTVR